MSSTEHEQNKQVGGLAGLGAGVIAGAAAGTAVMPVIGTFAGALLGGLVGNELGKNVGGALLDVFTPPPEHSPHYPPPQQSVGPQASGTDILSQLERLSQLKAQGIITEDEFRAAKARLLGM